MVQRLAKGVLPPNTQIHKDAVLAMSKSATVFVSYLSAQSVEPPFFESVECDSTSQETNPSPSRANENAHRSLKKTISPDHVLEALSELEFESFLPRLKLELASRL
jgi:DNA polymerase epsilon subunit 3